ncbi:type II toxin-antitoxin system RelE/ParE family toxin [Vibrio lentus]
MISALLNLVTDGVATYKQLNQNKAEALKRKDELENEKHQARVRQLPESGRLPPEIEHLNYREVVVNPCRVFYKQEADKVYILFVMRAERDLRRFLLSKQ